MEEMGPHGGRADQILGRLCSVEGRALECLGKARLTVTLGTRVVEWGFIVAEIGEDEGILGNDFAMAHELTVRPCEGAVYLPDQKATTLARKLVFEIVARYGAFRELHSDQGTNFGSKVVLEVCRLFGIHKTRTTPYHPRSDGFIERSFRTLGRCLKAACRETKQEWDELVPLILMSYRAMPQASTGVTPNMMMLGWQTRLPVQAMYGAPLGPEEEASIVSEYVAALQGGLRAAYRHRVGDGGSPGPGRWEGRLNHSSRLINHSGGGPL